MIVGDPGAEFETSPTNVLVEGDVYKCELSRIIGVSASVIRHTRGQQPFDLNYVVVLATGTTAMAMLYIYNFSTDYFRWRRSRPTVVQGREKKSHASLVLPLGGRARCFEFRPNSLEQRTDGTGNHLPYSWPEGQ